MRNALKQLYLNETLSRKAWTGNLFDKSGPIPQSDRARPGPRSDTVSREYQTTKESKELSSIKIQTPNSKHR